MVAIDPVRDRPRYDAFVVRLWFDQASGQCRRAEVEHVRIGARARAVEVPTAWVLGQIMAHLGASPSHDAAPMGASGICSTESDEEVRDGRFPIR